MTKEEAKEYLDNYRKMYAELAPERFLEALDIMLNEPLLPSNLDEAAEEYSNNLDYYHYTGDDPAVAFKAGAEWMAGQGETQKHLVINSTAGSPLLWPSCYTNDFKVGDEVIVQIRKK